MHQIWTIGFLKQFDENQQFLEEIEVHLRFDEALHLSQQHPPSLAAQITVSKSTEKTNKNFHMTLNEKLRKRNIY